MYTRSSRFLSTDILVDSVMSALRSEQPLVRQLAMAPENRRFALRWTAGEAVGTLFTRRKPHEDVRQEDARDLVIVFKRGGAGDKLSEYVALQMVGIAPEAMLNQKPKDQPTLHTAYPELTPSWPWQHPHDPARGNRCPWPGLEQLVLCYLNQDWAEDWATPDDALIDYLTGTADDELMRTLNESRQLLDAGDEGLLDEIFWQMGCAAAYASATDLLQSLADRIAHHIGGSAEAADRFGMGFLSAFHIQSMVPSSGKGQDEISGLKPSAIWHELDDDGPSPFTPAIALMDALGWDAALDQLNAPSKTPLTSMIDVCHSAFEQELTPELLVKLSEGSLDAVSDPLLRFLRYYGQYRGYGGGRLSVPGKPADELRPYIGPRISEARNRLYGRESFLSWSTPQDAFTYIDHLSVQLLYCHSLALRNPLSVIAPQLPGAERGYLGPTISESLRARLCSYLNFLHAIRELLGDGVIVLVEEPSWYEPTTIADLKERAYGMKSPVTRLLSHDVMEVMAAGTLPGLPPGIPSREQRELVGWAVSELLFDLTASHHTDGALDLSLSRGYFERVLGWLCDPQRSVEMNDLFKVDDLRVLTSLANAAIPDLSGAQLSARDIVAIRKNEVAFDEWRTTLRRVCRALATLPPDASDTVKRNVISEQVDEQARHLREKLGKNSRMRFAEKALWRFSIGAIVSMIPGAEIVKSTTETCVELLIEYAKVRDLPAQEASAHHYLLLTRAQDH